MSQVPERQADPSGLPRADSGRGQDGAGREEGGRQGLLQVRGRQPQHRRQAGGMGALNTKRQNELYSRFCELFFVSSPSLPWQHGTRQTGWYISGTLKR